MLYFEEPDTTAHAFGPESVQVLDYIQKVLIYLFILSLFMLFVNLGFFMQLLSVVENLTVLNGKMINQYLILKIVEYSCCRCNLRYCPVICLEGLSKTA